MDKTDITFGVITAFLMVALFFATLLFSRTECVNYATITEQNYQFKVIGGCFIETPNGWYSIDQIYTQEAQR